MIIAVNFPIEAIGRKKPEKYRGSTGRTQQIDLPMCGFTALLVEHRTGVAEVTGLNPVEALIFFRLLPSNVLNWKLYFDNYSSLSVSILSVF